MIDQPHIKALQGKLDFKEFKLQSLLEITNSINNNRSVDEICQLFEFVLKEQLGLRKYVLYQRQGSWLCLIKSGIKGKAREVDVIRDLLRFEKVTTIASSHNDVINSFDVVVPVWHKKKPLAFLLFNHSDLALYKSTSDTDALTNFVRTLTNIIVVAIENKRMAKESLARERLNKELEMAGEMQKQLFPIDLPSDKRLDISARFVPRHQLCGDYYDYIPLDEEEFIICIADVSGKGVSAAMLMANFQATFRTLLSLRRFTLEELVTILNEKVNENAAGEKFITFFVAEYNYENRTLHYLNAGHNPPVLTNGKSYQLLNKGSIGLGMMDELPFMESSTVDVPHNTTLVLYTDGVVELENEKDEAFEVEGLVQVFHRYYPLKMEDLNNILFGRLDEWRGNRGFTDDTAVLSCRIF